VSIDGVKSQESLALTADDINIHASIVARSDFKRSVERALRNSFGHSMFAKATLLYSTDPSLEVIFRQLHSIGERDTRIQQLQALIAVLTHFYKARKWFEIKDDLEYTALWILHAANNLAQLELGARGLLIGRDVIPLALAHNPALFKPVYQDLLNQKKTRKRLALALDAIEHYLGARQLTICEPILTYLSESGDPRSTTEISHYFERNHDIRGVVIACEWLADCDVIDRVSIPVKLTNRSHTDVEELAFMYIDTN
jgi:uncharacterized protein